MIKRFVLAIFLIFTLPVSVFSAEILVKAIDATHIDPTEDSRGCYKRGYPVTIMDDGHVWGAEENLPKFVVIKIPSVPVEKVHKYIEQLMDTTNPGNPIIVKRRLWKIRWDDLPQAVKNKFKTGVITIKAGTYTGDYDFTWSQVKSYFRNQMTGLDETEDL